MALFRTVLFPTDFSACAGAVRPLAVALAHDGAALHLLHVAPRRRSGTEEAEARLAALGEVIAGEAPVFVRTAVERDGAPGEAICRYAAAQGADVIVMGTHGRRGAARLLLGSTAREVIQLAPCPVLTLRPDDETPPPALQGGAILVAVDFSDASREAFRQAARLAAAFEARLDLLHVIEAMYRPLGYGYTLRSIADVEPGLDARAGEALRVFRAEVDHDAAHAGGMEILPGPPARALVAVAERLGSALVVLGARGLGGLGRLSMGSVAEAVVGGAPCPVLTVRAPEGAAAVRAEIARAAPPSPPAPLRRAPLPAF